MKVLFAIIILIVAVIVYCCMALSSKISRKEDRDETGDMR
jgi:hypothetical protein